MKGYFVFALMAALAMVCSAAEPKYTNKYDNINVDNILNNERILLSYIKCMLDEGPCTSEGRELKKLLPDALENDCSKCNPKQKTASQRVIRHLQSNRKSEWNKLTAKYDPQGKYEAKYGNRAPGGASKH